MVSFGGGEAEASFGVEAVVSFGGGEAERAFGGGEAEVNAS
jgi:hypothetical protein